MTPEAELVSTIIPVYNAADRLREAVASVLAQTYRPIEIVIVDDASTDDTPRVADELASDEIRVIHRKENGGPSRAREEGRKAIRGTYVQYLDCTDVLLPRKFELQVAALRYCFYCGVAYGWTRYRHADGRVEPAPWKRTGERIETMFPSMIASRWWETTTPLYRRSVIDAKDKWLPLVVDSGWEYDSRFARRGVHLAYVDDWVCEVRENADRYSARGHRFGRIVVDRYLAYGTIALEAYQANMPQDTPEMRQFARKLFILARQLGEIGLTEDARSVLKDAEYFGPSKDIRAYGIFANLVGWGLAGKLAGLVDRLRGRERLRAILEE